MIVALYARVSTAKQAAKELSIPDQLRQLRAWCDRQGHAVAVEYVEPGASATDGRRPVFQQMLGEANRERSFEDDRHLGGLTKIPRNGDTGRVREAIRATIEYATVGKDRTLTLDVKPQGLLGARQPLHIQGAGGADPQWRHDNLSDESTPDDSFTLNRLA